MRLALLALVIACGSNGPPDTKEQQEAIARLDAFADRVCACKSHDCAKQVNDSLEAYVRELDAKLGSGGGSAASAQMRSRLNDIMNRYTQCLTRNMRLPEGSASDGSAKPTEEPAK